MKNKKNLMKAFYFLLKIFYQIIKRQLIDRGDQISNIFIWTYFISYKNEPFCVDLIS